MNAFAYLPVRTAPFVYVFCQSCSTVDEIETTREQETCCSTTQYPRSCLD